MVEPTVGNVTIKEKGIVPGMPNGARVIHKAGPSGEAQRIAVEVTLPPNGKKGATAANETMGAANAPDIMKTERILKNRLTFPLYTP